MISSHRNDFNSSFTEKKYQAFLKDIEQQVNYKAPFAIAETPVFVPKKLTDQLLQACDELVDVICRPDFAELSKGAVLPEYDVPNETPHTDFLSVDFGICEDENGTLSPQLIEIQGFPSLFFYQEICAAAYHGHFEIPGHLNYLFGGLTSEGYKEKLQKIILGNSRPENVVMIDIEPETQNTRIDFIATENALGIKELCVADLKTEGKDVYYFDKNGKKTAVERIYNRVIFDELIKRTDLKREFLFGNEYNIEWVSHPNWFVRISKHSLPLFDSEFVPDSFYLNQNGLPGDLENYVLKPLFSFSGQGVILNPTQKDINAIPDKERSNFILQKKVKYAPIIKTPDEPAKAEIRMMMAWEKGAERPEVLTSLVRLSKGDMVGVRYNKGKTWVGGSIGFFEM